MSVDISKPCFEKLGTTRRNSAGGLQNIQRHYYEKLDVIECSTTRADRTGPKRRHQEEEAVELFAPHCANAGIFFWKTRWRRIHLELERCPVGKIRYSANSGNCSSERETRLAMVRATPVVKSRPRMDFIARIF